MTEDEAYDELRRLHLIMDTYVWQDLVDEYVYKLAEKTYLNKS